LWEEEFCIISDVFGWLPCQIRELTPPQFYTYRRYAINKLSQEGIGGIEKMLVGKQNTIKNPVRVPSPDQKLKSKNAMEAAVMKNKYHNTINNIDHLAEAAKAMKEKTGKNSFSLSDVAKEIINLHPVKGAKVG